MCTAMRIAICMAVILSVPMVAQGYYNYIGVHVSAPTPVTEPFTGEALKSYVVSLEAPGVGEKITALDVRFDSPSGKLHQLAAYKSGFGAHYTPTPMNDLAGQGWPAEYIAADSHFLMTSANAVWPSGKAANEDLSESYLPRDSYDIWHSWGTYLKSDPMGLDYTLQASTVPLAQIVIPASASLNDVSLTGMVATNQSPDPYIIDIPEPGTMGFLIFGIGVLARNVRKGGSK